MRNEYNNDFEAAEKMEDRLIALAKNTEIKQQLEKADEKIRILKNKLKDKKLKFAFKDKKHKFTFDDEEDYEG